MAKEGITISAAPLHRPAEQPVPDPRRWYGLAILTLVATLSGLDETLVPAMAEPIRHEFRLSDTQFGLVAGLIYSTGFAAGGVPLTLLIDRVGRIRLLAALLAIWSAATGLGALVGSYAQLAATRFLVGAAEVGGQPISMTLIAGWFPVKLRGTAMGLWSISRSVSLMVSFAFGGYAAVHLGWRNAFLAAGVPGLLLSVLIVTTLREPVGPADDVGAARPAAGAAISTLLREPSLLLLALALVLAVGCQNGVMAFLSSLLTRSHALAIDRAGFFSGVILGLDAGVGMPLGGILTDLLGRRSVHRQYGVVAILMLLAAPAGLAGLLARAVGWAVAGLFLFELLTSCAYTAGLSTYLNTVPTRLRGSLSSLLTILVIFVGAGVGPLAAGFASDRVGSLRDGLALSMAGMVAAAVLVVIGARRLPPACRA